MTSEPSFPSTNKNDQDSNPTILQVKNKPLLYKQELSLYKKSLNIQRAKRKSASIVKFSREESMLYHISKAANRRCCKMQAAALKSSKVTKELDIHYAKMACRQHKMLNHIMENIKRWSSLQSLKLHFSWAEENQHFKVTNPQHNCSLIHNMALYKIFHALQRLNSLQTFCFHFSNCKMTDEGLAYFCRILKRMKNLKDLTLNFSKCNLLARAGIQKICKILKRISFLEAVSLDFSKCNQLVESEFHFILQTLQGMSSLHSANLQFSGCPQISNLRFQNLHSYLQRLTFLKRFSLDFSECQINDQEVEKLCIALKKLTSLPNLSLNFSKCPHFTENGLHTLSKSLQTMTNLTHLSLSFSSSWVLYDTGLNIFAGSLKKLMGLKGLSLDFKECRNLTSAGLNKISEALMDLLCLQSIKLNFASDQALDNIANLLEKMIHIQNISFDFSGCAISDVGLQKIHKAIEKLGTVKYVKIER